MDPEQHEEAAAAFEDLIPEDIAYLEALATAERAVLDAKAAVPYQGDLERREGSMVDTGPELQWIDGLFRQLRAAQADIYQAQSALAVDEK